MHFCEMECGKEEQGISQGVWDPDFGQRITAVAGIEWQRIMCHESYDYCGVRSDNPMEREVPDREVCL